MRVDLLINSLRGGGAERVCTTVANGLAACGYDPHVVVLNLRQAVYHTQLDERVQLHSLNKGRVWKSSMVLAQYLLRERPSILLVFNPEIAVLLVALRAVLGVDVRIIARSINTLSALRAQQTSSWRHIVHMLIAAMYRRVDHVIAQSQGMAEDLHANYGFQEEDVTVIHNPVAQHVVKAGLTPPPLKRVGAPHELLFVGRLAPQKGLAWLFKAVARCCQIKDNLQLRLVGDGEQREELERLAIQLGIADVVFFEGFQENIIPFYQRADLTVLTSRFEGFPNVLVESISLGTPVVAFDCPSGPSEIIHEGHNGYLVPLGDVEQLSVAILQALERAWDPEEVRETAYRFRPECIIKAYVDTIVRQ